MKQLACIDSGIGVALHSSTATLQAKTQWSCCHNSEGNNFHPMTKRHAKISIEGKGKNKKLADTQDLKKTYLPCTLFTGRPLQDMLHQHSHGNQERWQETQKTSHPERAAQGIPRMKAKRMRDGRGDASDTGQEAHRKESPSRGGKWTDSLCASPEIPKRRFQQLAVGVGLNKL